MTKWIDVGPQQDLPTGRRQCAKLEGQSIVVFNLEGRYYALENRCTHAGLPLEDGDLSGCALTCPYHGFTFNITNGQNVDDPKDTPVRTYPVKCENGRVLVGLEPLF